MLKIGEDLKQHYTYEKIHYKGGGEILGNVTGGLIGESSAEKAAKRQRREAEEAARRQTEMFNKQMEEERKRRAEEQKRAIEEAKRAREEQAKLIEEARKQRESEAEYAKKITQDAGALTQANINAATNRNKKSTKIDYSGSIDKRTDEQKEKDKLRKAFKVW